MSSSICQDDLVPSATVPWPPLNATRNAADDCVFKPQHTQRLDHTSHEVVSCLICTGQSMEDSDFETRPGLMGAGA